ncbi:hypothetical protein EEL31_08950 [Brevibacillus laterosporus]|nr:hypothetical protein EEL31_08950 [Brevibacillus laterosporus]
MQHNPRYIVKYYLSDGRSGMYVGNTIFEVHRSVDADCNLEDILKSIFKYGYFWEFENEDYKTRDYVIDNCIHISWVRTKID